MHSSIMMDSAAHLQRASAEDALCLVAACLVCLPMRMVAVVLMMMMIIPQRDPELLWVVCRFGMPIRDSSWN